MWHCCIHSWRCSFPWWLCTNLAAAATPVSVWTTLPSTILFIPLSSFVHPQATLPSTTLFIPLSSFVYPQATLPSTTLFIPLSSFVYPQATLPSTTLHSSQFLCSPTGHFTQHHPSFLSVPLFTHRPLYPAPPSSFLSVPLFTHRPLYPAPPSSFLCFFVHPQATLPSTTLFIPLFLCSPTGHFTQHHPLHSSVSLFTHRPLYLAPPSSFLSVLLFTYGALYPPSSSFLSIPFFTHIMRLPHNYGKYRNVWIMSSGDCNFDMNRFCH